jgi:hypothetical protein
MKKLLGEYGLIFLSLRLLRFKSLLVALRAERKLRSLLSVAPLFVLEDRDGGQRRSQDARPIAA